VLAPPGQRLEREEQGRRLHARGPPLRVSSCRVVRR
jgi:hypothetical protein